jgi:hypothetical protein
MSALDLDSTRSHRSFLRALVVTVVILGTTKCAHADFAVLQIITNVGTAGGVNPTIGWEFIPLRPIRVTKLGYFDAHFDGLLASHDLGMFDVATRALLTRGTVPSGFAAPIEGPAVAGGGFRYVSVPEVVLEPGNNYVIAATPANYLDQAADYDTNHPNNYYLQTAPDIAFVDGRYNFFSPPGLAFPNSEFNVTAFGPSFQFVIVPEPPTSAIIAIGVAILFLTRRRNN